MKSKRYTMLIKTEDMNKINEITLEKGIRKSFFMEKAVVAFSALNDTQKREIFAYPYSRGTVGINVKLNEEMETILDSFPFSRAEALNKMFGWILSQPNIDDYLFTLD